MTWHDLSRPSQAGVPVVPGMTYDVTLRFGEPSGPCWHEGCPAPPTIIEGDGFGPDHLACDAHSLMRNIAMALPMGYHARTLGFPLAAPYTSQVVYPGTAG